MTFNVHEFRAVSNINNGFQKLNKYIVRFPIPAGMVTDFHGRNNGQLAIDTVRYLDFQCSSTGLPGLSLTTRPILRYGYGATEKKPMAPVFEDVMMTFYADNNLNNLQFFHDWMRLICRYEPGHSVVETTTLNGKPSAAWELGYIGEYAVDAEVRTYNDHGTPNYGITMREMFPIAIPETKMTWQPTQQVMQIAVLFTFVDWSINRGEFDVDPHAGDHTTGDTTHGGENPAPH